MKPWDNEPTPMTEASRLRIDSDDSCCGIYTLNADKTEYIGDVCRSDRMADLERRLRHAERLLEECMEVFSDPCMFVKPRIEAHLAAAREEERN